MTRKEIGEIIKRVREEKLGYTQQEMARALKSNQVAISRIEKGTGLTVEILFKFMDLLKKNKFNSSALFFEPFDMSLLGNDYSTNIDQILHIIDDMKQSNDKDYDKIKLLINNL